MGRQYRQQQMDRQYRQPQQQQMHQYQPQQMEQQMEPMEEEPIQIKLRLVDEEMSIGVMQIELETFMNEVISAINNKTVLVIGNRIINGRHIVLCDY